MDLKETIRQCAENGERLLEDADFLKDMERYPSAYAFAKLAQEEFAKALILKLVSSGALQWTPEVRWTLNHHVPKQLMSVILDYLHPTTEDFLEKIRTGTLFKWPKKMADSINIYIHEILKRRESKNWEWAEDPHWDAEATQVFNGKEERRKHDALYVSISRDGKAVSRAEFQEDEVAAEIDRAKRFSSFARNDNPDALYGEVAHIVKLLTQKS